MKKWYQSRTILLQLAVAVVAILRILDVEIADDFDQKLVESVMLGGAFLTTILRTRTNEAIEGPAKH